MNTSNALIAAIITAAVATLSGGVSAATTQSTLLDKTASTSASTIWTTGELGFIQNPNGAMAQSVMAPKLASTVNSNVDFSAKTSATTVWTNGEVGYIQNADRDAVAANAALPHAMSTLAVVKLSKDTSITY